MVEQVNEPSWQEMDKAISIIEHELELLVYRNSFSGYACFLPNRAETERLYLELRKVFVEHARISN
ncbi:hypothetical protein LDX65_10345 [Acinetobacter baumannii]|uniref:hypothetical protein n=1 Tax=Acinetobacter baumannii TaxID=470 RepID=UPI001CDB9EE5|nr:hypothetical protein [Acinetobacter baumannii]MCA4303663.1 hypothetical protein [Acinetobacter baumannii]